MFSIQKFFSQDGKFFDLLEASADETRESTRLLIDLLKDRSHPHPLEEFALSRGKDKRITEQISHELVNTFVTGLEREDIEMVSYALYRICKTIEKFAERFNLAPQRLAGVDFHRQIQLMERATATLSDMVRLLRKMPPLETMKGLNDRLQGIEGEADDVMLDLLREVYSGQYEPLQAMMVRDLYDLLEKVIDRCRDAGNAISHIVLKNS
ncbi:MAG: pit accessory protein [Pirellula sp.]|nr:pit accessory protein [Pirellula sp.]